MEFISLSGEPEDLACCENILAFLQREKKKIYYYNDFLAAIDGMRLRDPIQNVQRCLNVLKSKRIGILKQEYRYLDDDGVVYPVETEDLQAASQDGQLYLEWRNHADAGYLSKVYIVFVPLEVGL